MAQNPRETNTPPQVTSANDQAAPLRTGKASRTPRSIRTTPPAYRWECPCQEPPVLLATYGPKARVNIKVRDRYWHLYGFGQVQAVCPRCAGEHLLDLRLLHRTLNGYSEDQLELDTGSD